MPAVKRQTVLAIVATDTTFKNVLGQWRGKCIHCRSELVVDADGSPLGRATVEHIVPRHHGGDDRLENLALACARCNHEKGKRHDHKRRGDQRLLEVIARLARERAGRWPT